MIFSIVILKAYVILIALSENQQTKNMICVRLLIAIVIFNTF